MTSLKKRVDKFSHMLMDRIALLTLADAFDGLRAMYEKDAGYHPPVEWNGSGE